MFIGCVKAKCWYLHLLIGAEGRKTPARGRGRGDPTGASAPRRLPEPPAESEVPRDRQKPPITAVIIR